MSNHNFAETNFESRINENENIESRINENENIESQFIENRISADNSLEEEHIAVVEQVALQNPTLAASDPIGDTIGGFFGFIFLFLIFIAVAGALSSVFEDKNK